MAQPTPPPIIQTFLSPSVSVGLPKGPAKSHISSPASLWKSRSVVLPATLNIIFTVPFFASLPAIVSGILSPSSSTLKIINCPGFALAATNGASISICITFLLSFFLLTILYISHSLCFLSVIIEYTRSKFYGKHLLYG